MKDKELRELLIKIGISSNVKGFHYILDAVKILKKQQIHTKMITLYKLIGKKENNRPCAVERAIRYSISRAYEDGKILKQIYYKSPDNSVFLYDLIFNFDIFQDKKN